METFIPTYVDLMELELITPWLLLCDVNIKEMDLKSHNNVKNMTIIIDNKQDKVKDYVRWKHRHLILISDK